MKSFENSSYSVEANEEAGCLIQLKIMVKPEATRKSYKAAVKRVNKQISIPGFRKGKAPDATVIQRYSSYVEQEWKDILINDAYRGSLELTQIYPMNRDSIQKPKIESCSQEEGAIIRLSYEHYPEVPTIDFTEITLPEIEKAEVTQERVDEIIQEIQRAHADWEDVTGKKVEQGDFADVTIDAIDEDPPKTIVKERRFEVKDERMAPWLRKLLVGLDIGESAEGTSEVDEKADQSVKDKFKPTKVRVTVHAIKKVLPPELNDELAKKVGTTSVDDLIEKIRHNLEQEAEDEQKRQRVEALERALLEKYHFELPASLVESERRERLKEHIQHLKSENLSDEEIKNREKALEQQVVKEVDEALRLYFLNKQIAKQGEISLTNQELNDEIVRQMSQNAQLYGQNMGKEMTQEIVSRMAQSLMQRKAKEYALSKVLSKTT